ncbi:U11/U12 small nuclear ribonucleoprotein 25 kDa protein, partial [Linum perenne]
KNEDLVNQLKENVTSSVQLSSPPRKPLSWKPLRRRRKLEFPVSDFGVFENQIKMSLVDTRIELGSPGGPTTDFLHRRSNSLPFLSLYGFSDNASFSYSKLPARPITLSILKLDGTCFDVEVKNSASVAELKHAVETAFSYMPQKGPGKISWQHVWGHFCLSYHGQKLLSEADSISNFGIREGDQLQFIRHVSTTLAFTKKESIKRVSSAERNKITLLLSQTVVLMNLPGVIVSSLKTTRRHAAGIELNADDDDCFSDMENGTFRPSEESDLGMIELQEAIDPSLASPWNPYSKLSPKESKRKFKVSPSRYGCGLFSGFKNIAQFCGTRY